ncbi:MAG: Spy/CpxP family protein refolding chaperone [Burkholderiaceae bacterium]
MNLVKATIVIACALTTVTARSQTHAADPGPYAGEQSRAIKALSASEVDDLRAGRGMGLSKAAELNHKAGPRHVLDLADPLALSDVQRAEVQDTFDRMAGVAKTIGAAILDKERALDAHFARNDAGPAEVERSIDEIARLQGQLRFTHIDAHMRTAHVLTADQIAAYDRLRGYDGTSGVRSVGAGEDGGATHEHSH